MESWGSKRLSIWPLAQSILTIKGSISLRVRPKSGWQLAQRRWVQGRVWHLARVQPVGAITASGPTFTLVNFKGPGKLFGTQRADTHKVTISFGRTKQDAMIQNLLINNETLPSSLSRKLQMNLQ